MALVVRRHRLRFSGDETKRPPPGGTRGGLRGSSVCFRSALSCRKTRGERLELVNNGITGDVRGQGQYAPKSRGNEVGYQFDRPPQIALDYMRDRHITPLDYAALSALLRYHRAGDDWCWASNETIAEMIGRHPDQMKAVAKRLDKCGLVERHRVPKPDPDRPENRTGWRCEFPVDGPGWRGDKNTPSAPSGGGARIPLRRACRGGKNDTCTGGSLAPQRR